MLRHHTSLLAGEVYRRNLEKRAALGQMPRSKRALLHSESRTVLPAIHADTCALLQRPPEQDWALLGFYITLYCILCGPDPTARIHRDPPTRAP